MTAVGLPAEPAELDEPDEPDEPADTVRLVLEGTLIPRLLAGAIDVVVSETAQRWALVGGADEERPGGAWGGSTPHAHSGYGICWVLSGRCELTMDGERYLLDRRVAFLITPGELHRLGPTHALEPFEVLWWSVTPRGVSLPVESFANERRVTGVGFVELEPALTSMPAQVAREVKAGEAQWGLVTRALLLQAAGVMVRKLEQRERVHPGLWERSVKVSQHVQSVAHFVETHYGTEITLERLARVAGVSPYYLTTLFRRYTGRSALAYLADVRQRQAMELLRNTDLDVAAVARLVGYEDPYYFSRVFKERNGCSPRAFRRMYTGVPASAGGPTREADGAREAVARAGATAQDLAEIPV
ncbi:MAG TPA: AraC family transcriptional regulator [Chloroflexota bacterium]|nr:AraC family transcriptional regulator [Chloroflexota bacterium]